VSTAVQFITPGAQLAIGFEHPFEMLESCHEKVQRMLALLQRLREHAVPHGADEQARQAARDVMRYFDIAAPQHHQDEELHVFPALLAQGSAETHALVARLLHEHTQMDSGWRAARALLARLADGCAGFTPAEEDVLDDFAGLYRTHIEAEEQLAYPAAEALLARDELRAMSREMMTRHGANPLSATARPTGVAIDEDQCARPDNALT
jgi:hemerythrin-like domain-containing protein